MRKFFSITILSLLLASGLWTSAAYWFGLKTEDQYRDFLRQASSWQSLKLANESYHRGLFESNARTLIEIEQPAATHGGSQPIRFTVDHNIIHGPFPFSTPVNGKRRFTPLMAIIESRLVLGGEGQNQLAELHTQVPELASARDCTLVNLDGSGEEHLTVPAFQHTLGKEGKADVVWKGLSLKVNFTGDLKGFTGSLHIPGLEIVAKDTRLSIQEVTAAFDSHEGICGLALGNASLDIASLDIASKTDFDPPTFLIRALSVRTSSKAAGDAISLSVALKTGQAKIGEDPYGPGIFEMEFRNLDAASLAKLQHLIKEQQTQPVHQSREAMQMAMLAGFGEILPGLLRMSPELEVSQLDLETALGDFYGKARISFDAKQLGSMLNLLGAARAITAEAEFKAGERLLHHIVFRAMKEKITGQRKEPRGTAPNDQETNAIASSLADEQLEALRAQNLLVKTDGQYGARVSYMAGELILNGRPLSLQDLLR